MSPFVLYSVIILGQIIFASTPLFIKVGLRDFDPFTLALIRFLISIILLNIFLWIKGIRLIPKRKNVLLVLFLGLMAIPLNQGLLFYGLQFTTPGHASLMYGLTPILVYLFAIFILREKFKLRKLLGILAAFGGILLVLVDQDVDISPHFAAGDLIIFGGVVAWALYTVYGKRLVKEIGSLQAIVYSMTFGTLLFVPVGAYPALTFDYGTASSLSWISLLYIAVITSGIAYPVWYWALKYMEASKLSVFIYTQPILATTLSAIFLHEALTTNFIIGGIIVILGVAFTERA